MPAPQPQFYDSTDTSLISAPITSTVTAGNTLAAVVYHLWNDKGGSLGAGTLQNARLRAVAYDGTNKVTSGIPALDEAWLQVQITGKDSTGAASMQDQTSGYVPLGTNRSLTLSDIPQNCARYLSAKIVVPAGAANNVQEIYLEVVYDETSDVLGSATTLWNGSAVIPLRFDVSARRLTSGGTITASGTADVVATRRQYSYDGSPYYAPQATVTLNQTAADGALTAGQSYIAVLSQAVAGTSPTTTKGNRSASPVAPATPSNHVFLGKVTVAYQGGGVSIINQGSVDQTGTVWGEYYLQDGGALVVKIWTGESISAADTKTFSTAVAFVDLANNSSTWIWINADGTFSTSDDIASIPSVGAILLGLVVTGPTSITSIIQAPTYGPRAERAINEYVMILRYHGEMSAFTNVAWDTLPYGAVLEHVTVACGSAGTGGAGTAVFDINSGGGGAGPPATSIYVSQGTDNRRPSIATPSTFFSGPFTDHDTRFFVAGTKFNFDIDSLSGSTTYQSDVFVVLHFRRDSFLRA